MTSSRPIGQIHPPQASFVGREIELREFTEAGDRALSGRGTLALIAGEAGIGKTRFVEEVADGFARRGAVVFRGRSHELEGAPPYWPWVQILRDFIERTDPDLRSESAGYLVPILPDLADKIPNDLQERVAAPSNDPAQARFQLFDSVAASCARKARRSRSCSPAMTSNGPTRRRSCCSHFCLELIDAPVLLIGVSRNIEVYPDSPLALALPKLIGSAAHHVKLAGLERTAVAQLTNEVIGRPADESFIDDLIRRTGGNPFFIRELVRWHRTRTNQPESNPPGIPETIRMLINERFNQVSAPCREILTIASIVGREIDLVLLERVVGKPTSEVLDALAEASRAGLLEDERGFGSFRFSHDLILETLYDGHSPSQLIELHGRVGRMLEERYAGNPSLVLGQLARHYAASPVGSNREKAIDYALLAANQAKAQSAWEVAIDYHETALDLLRQGDTPDPTRQCELLLQLAETQHNAPAGGYWKGESRSRAADGLATSWEAVEMAREAGSPDHFARAALSVVGINPFMPRAGVDGLSLLEEALNALPEDDSPLRVKLLSRLGSETWQLMHHGLLTWSSDRIQRSREASDAAVAMARRIGDPVTLFHTLYARDTTRLTAEEIDESLADADERLEIADASGDNFLIAVALLAKQATLAGAGRIAEAERILPEVEQAVARAQTTFLDTGLLTLKFGSVLRAGRFDDAEELIQKIEHIAPNLDPTLWRLFALRRHQDRVEEVAGRIEQVYVAQQPHPLVTDMFYAVSRLDIGDETEARETYKHLAAGGFPDMPDLLRPLALMTELGIAFEDEECARILYDRLRPYARFPGETLATDDMGDAVAYHLGLLAAFLGHWDDAERHFSEALELHEQWGMQPAVARTLHAQAAMLFQRGKTGDIDRAESLLDEATEIADRLGMARLLGRIEDLKAQLVSSEQERPAGLTVREVEVLELIVQGRTNQEIADELFISPHTVANHVAHIMNKLRVDSRTAAATWAVSQGLHR
ncbi:MAG: LuxR C-terminal-related transcriptional regulator [Thermomicrobiales bacterium]